MEIAEIFFMNVLYVVSFEQYLNSSFRLVLLSGDMYPREPISNVFIGDHFSDNTCVMKLLLTFVYPKKVIC